MDTGLTSAPSSLTTSTSSSGKIATGLAAKGHGVNKCTKLTHAQRKQSWEDHNKARHEKANTASKEITANAAIAEVVAVVPEEDDVARVKYER